MQTLKISTFLGRRLRYLKYILMKFSKKHPFLFEILPLLKDFVWISSDFSFWIFRLFSLQFCFNWKFSKCAGGRLGAVRGLNAVKVPNFGRQFQFVVCRQKNPPIGDERFMEVIDAFNLGTHSFRNIFFSFLTSNDLKWTRPTIFYIFIEIRTKFQLKWYVTWRISATFKFLTTPDHSLVISGRSTRLETITTEFSVSENL